MENFELKRKIKEWNNKEWMGETELIDTVGAYFMGNNFNRGIYYLHNDNGNILTINYVNNKISSSMNTNIFINEMYSITIDTENLKINSISLDIIENKKSIIY